MVIFPCDGGSTKLGVTPGGGVKPGSTLGFEFVPAIVSELRNDTIHSHLNELSGKDVKVEIAAEDKHFNSVCSPSV